MWRTRKHFTKEFYKEIQEKFDSTDSRREFSKLWLNTDDLEDGYPFVSINLRVDEDKMNDIREYKRDTGSSLTTQDWGQFMNSFVDRMLEIVENYEEELKEKHGIYIPDQEKEEDEELFEKLIIVDGIWREREAEEYGEGMMFNWSLEDSVKGKKMHEVAEFLSCVEIDIRTDYGSDFHSFYIKFSIKDPLCMEKVRLFSNYILSIG